MKKYAVCYINFFDNKLIIEIIEAEDWFNALSNHSKFKDDEMYLPNTSLEDAKIEAFNCDSMIDVIEIN